MPVLHGAAAAYCRRQTAEDEKGSSGRQQVELRLVMTTVVVDSFGAMKQRPASGSHVAFAAPFHRPAARIAGGNRPGLLGRRQAWPWLSLVVLQSRISIPR